MDAILMFVEMVEMVEMVEISLFCGNGGTAWKLVEILWKSCGNGVGF
jgi:hypothetical protein